MLHLTIKFVPITVLKIEMKYLLWKIVIEDVLQNVQNNIH